MKAPFLLVPALALVSGCVGKAQYNETVASYHQITEELAKTKEERDQCKARITDMERRVSESEERAQELTQSNQVLLSKNRNYAERTLNTQKEVLKYKQERQTKDERSSSLARVRDDFERAVGAEAGVSVGKVQGGALVVAISDELLFAPGTLTLEKSSYALLKKIASILKRTRDESLVIESHTDTALSPKQKKAFGSLWELSSLRATRVVRYLEGQGVDPKRLSAVGRGPYRPVASGEIHENRVQNRRLEIHVVEN